MSMAVGLSHRRHVLPPASPMHLRSREAVGHRRVRGHRDRRGISPRRFPGPLDGEVRFGFAPDREVAVAVAQGPPRPSRFRCRSLSRNSGSLA